MAWLQITFECTPDTAERLTSLLEELGAVSVTLRDAADQPIFEPPRGSAPLWGATLLTALFEGDADRDALLLQVAAGWAPEPLPPARVEVLEDQDWTRSWMDDFHPMQFGRRLWIVPSWCTPPDPAAVNLMLDPGLAFGSGTHPTTTLCLQWLDGLALEGMTVVDYGCGSGVLAIAAARLGAETVWAVDNDPQALLATEDNAARNEVGGRIRTFLPDDLPALQADVVVANILAGPLLTLAPLLAHLARPGGHLALSGILAEQAAEVATAYAPWFELEPPTQQEEWVRLEGTMRS